MHTTPVRHKHALGDTVWRIEWCRDARNQYIRRVANEPVTVASLLPHIDAEGQYCEYYVELSAGYDPLSEDDLFASRELAQADCDKRNEEAKADEAQ